MTDSTLIRWIDGEAPAGTSSGTTWGMPFPRGTVHGPDALTVTDAGGARVPSQAWPLATWPDGSLKWAGIALPATDSPSASYQVGHDAGAAPSGGDAPPSGVQEAQGAPGAHGGARVSVAESPGAFTVDTGALQMEISRSGSTLFTSLTSGRDEEDPSVSSLIDTWIQLDNENEAGQMRRTLFVRKARGMAHSGTVRRLHLADDGITLRNTHGDPGIGQEGGERR